MDIVTYILATKGTEDLVDELVAKGFEFSTSSSLILISDSEQDFIDKIQIEEERISEFGDYFYDKISDWNEETGCLISLKLPPTYEINLIKLEELEDKADGIVNEVSGDGLVNVNDSDELSLKGLRLFGKTTQDGTPTPEAPVELVNVENSKVSIFNKNLLYNTQKSTTQKGVEITVNNDKSLTFNGTATGDIYFSLSVDTFLKKGRYFLSGTPGGGGLDKYYIYLHPGYYSAVDANGSAFEVTEDTVFTARIYIASGTVCDNLTFRPQIEIGSARTEYEPCRKQSIELPYTLRGVPVSSGGNYTDDSGQQWICDEVDFERGVLIKRTATKVFDGTEAFVLYANKLDYGYIYLYRDNDRQTRANVLCNTYPNATSYHTRNTVWGGLSLTFNTDFETVDNFKEYLSYRYAQGNPLVVIYILAESIETPLTAEQIEAFKALHSYYPNTTVTNDSGAGMKISYTADTKTYIDNKFAEIQNLILQGG